MIDSLNRYEQLHDGAYLSTKTHINTDNPVVASFINGISRAEENCFGSVNFVGHIPQHVIDRINDTFGTVYQQNEGGYAIELDDDITIYSGGLRGFIYGAADLTRMASGGFIRQGIVYNAPLAEFRSLKAYLPPQENIGAFKEIVDLCCRYRCNKLILEIGGAMEYKRHPEMNEGWVSYCREMHEYSGKTTKIQEHTFPWGKNSIHCENGGGKYLSQEQVRDIVDYCRARGIDVIPEMPTLSHCDYLLTRHHEFAERQNDPYADAYCPSAPGIYDYVLDVLDEVVDVFQPAAMHIGHDELYSICVCDRCRGKNAADLYADDIIRIHGHLAARGVGTIIWSEKLLNGITPSGTPVGGAERKYAFEGKVQHTIPATYPAMNRMPKDIQCMHWYWPIVEKWDDEFLRRGFYTVFGNMDPMAMPNAPKRLKNGVKGGGPSNWSYCTLPYLQENGVLASLAYAALLYWKDGISDEMYADCLDFCFQDLFRLKNMELSEQPRIEILHTTTCRREFMYHADGVFIDENEDLIGEYVINYDDGGAVRIPVIYGRNIANKDCRWERFLGKEALGKGFDCDSEGLDYECYIYDKLLASVAYSTLPERTGGETWYRILIKNPYPERKITGFQIAEKEGLDGKLLVKEMKLR